MSTERRLSTLALLLVATVSLSLAGCRDSSRRTIEAPPSMERWFYSASLQFEDDDENYLWESALSGVVRLQFDVDEYLGNTRVRVYDGAGVKVIDELFVSDGSAGGDDFRDTVFSDPAVPGTWRIRLDHRDVFGRVKVTIEEN